jgi:hypothetical protein
MKHNFLFFQYLKKVGFLFVLAAGILSVVWFLQRNAPAQPERLNEWVKLVPGLDLGVFVGSKKTERGDSKIRILRIDTKYFDFHLLNASAIKNQELLSAKDWARRYGLVATINPSMYQENNSSSVSLQRFRGHVNHSRLSKDRTLFAFDSLTPSVPKAQIIDRDCQDLQALDKEYSGMIQSIRMISCNRENVWELQDKVWSATAIGSDDKGRILFIHARTPFTMHDLVDMLLELPIGLQRAMYTEGGPEAQLYLNAGGREFEFVGKFADSEGNVGENGFGWPIPNVLGIVPVAKKTGN